MKSESIIGNRYGMLTVLSFSRVVSKNSKWICVCDCGATKEIFLGALKYGNTKSCGCLAITGKSGNFTINGMYGSPEYVSWRAMLARCRYKKINGYNNYGGRGIGVCKRWMDFNNFYKDMGKRPVNKTIDRKDNGKGYYPGNCVWSDPKTQARNKRINKRNKTGVNGVFFSRNGKYQAQIKYEGLSIHLGTFEKLSAAERARKNAEQKYWR